MIDAALAEPVSEAEILAQRVVFLCAECAAHLEVGLEEAVVEPGFEDAFDGLNQRGDT